MNNAKVILVDPNDVVIGEIDKKKAHKGSGMLHRAISVLVVRKANGEWETMMQKRSSNKELWPGFWTNTICTHPFIHESYVQSAIRRLKEEMGISAEEKMFHTAFRFEYHASYNDLVAEHELDTVLFCVFSKNPILNQNEAEDYQWISLKILQNKMKEAPDSFTPWFIQIIQNQSTIKTLNQL
jgi:isopentenyl-diphosphate Delta-isomerase